MPKISQNHKRHGKVKYLQISCSRNPRNTKLKFPLFTLMARSYCVKHAAALVCSHLCIFSNEHWTKRDHQNPKNHKISQTGRNRVRWSDSSVFKILFLTRIFWSASSIWWRDFQYQTPPTTVVEWFKKLAAINLDFPEVHTVEKFIILSLILCMTSFVVWSHCAKQRREQQ